MRQAIATANELEVPLIVAGDLHDTKANMRGECVNAMLETIKLCFARPYILVGNHDKINEKSEDHSLNFLFAYANIVDKPHHYKALNINLIPYQHDITVLKKYLGSMHRWAITIMHQGIEGSKSGDYIQDKTALSIEDVSELRIISGHYHTRQTIALPNGGQWDYIGNPYTLTYAEANDPTKGYQILYSNGLLDFIPTNLRAHRVLKMGIRALFEGAYGPIKIHNPEDLVLIKLDGIREDLSKITKNKVGAILGLNTPFRLDLIPTDTATQAPDARLNLSEGPLLDSLIDSLSNTSDERKTRLKSIWKALK
jgi:DNA repair exonuclease SbcCD nuclease subunit